MRKRGLEEWVVFRSPAEGQLASQPAVCTQAEWDEFERTSPGRRVLVRGHIGSEAEAERVARDLQAVPEPPKKVRKLSADNLRRLAERQARQEAYAKSLQNLPAASGGDDDELSTDRPTP